ncbi:AP-1-like transcription factor [Madurella mycetomatis]|uniref:AP-1-like transcription factor n=1 Tax=Madurella mycetomatis TaxID=100816 RepID=A0A175VXX1_9PEZI|nr:AP-1-like transcription factor [Madurella mycetomatis]
MASPFSVDGGTSNDALGDATQSAQPSAGTASSVRGPVLDGTEPGARTRQQQAQSESRGGTPSSNTTATDAGSNATKRRKTGPGSRGVANLTPEQLAKKRANDREAQRAIRERQRLRTEHYEREIRELKSQQPYLELQAALRQKEAVEAELADVKRCLAAIMAMIQPVLARPVDSPGQTHPPTHLASVPPTHNATESTPVSAASPASVGTHGRWQSSLSPVVPSIGMDGPPLTSPHTALMFSQQRHDLIHGLDLGSDRLGLDFLLDQNQKIARIQNGINGAQDSPQYRHVPMKHDWTGISMMSTFPAPAQTQHQTQSPIYAPTSVTPASIPPPAGPFSQLPTGTAAGGPENMPIPAILPKNSRPTCPLDSLLLDFLSERRQRAAEGLSQTEILGPRYPSVSSLLNPSVSVYSHPLSKVFTDILARFPDLSTLPERVAVLYLMFLLMRWQVSPTHENYLRLPDWFRPLPVQTDKEHPAWIDHIPFPGMRGRLVSDYEPGEFPFDNFFIPFTSTLCVNWPYEDVDVLLASPAGDELMINPVFERHMRRLENWTLGPAFERAFPGLVGCYKLKRES